ncbi:hypothetical protein HanRHA438_Chr09g0393801 [Helianthus annuus]|uniref:Uncharacterized protein n=1 Tax=Helianthus annuus TaxID=4232 RepID=A0A251RXA9_HELAN|nr:hypothetical protein HanXRQr2_Chr09g0382271 [Helianthus annuus]KAJ0525584.1 hypothetical protein HanHA300_Chr09g0313711 [Helianthus annuus]KAJ0541967.1 hypothetical protein HanHA89_Chr09g0334581 [Helianthus annuus]KAJ0707034.1 hypothetical protein HanLR1_Chr09g0313951 [Helianthus annuus]KAJ0711056.1 hypothetical protein HanOQP8_Chr09g0319541 [Helianthus annuus]
MPLYFFFTLIKNLKVLHLSGTPIFTLTPNFISSLLIHQNHLLLIFLKKFNLSFHRSEFNLQKFNLSFHRSEFNFQTYSQLLKTVVSIV